ncbi:MAG: Uma2 family endonuclease [bacterium]
MRLVKRRASYADLAALPDTVVAEIIDGDLYASPRPASPHAYTATALGVDLHSAFNGPPAGGRPGGWWMLIEPELHLDRDVIVPDWAGWRRERMPVMPHVVGFTLAPDWVCEVESPSTRVVDRTHKMRIYAREGVSHLWMVDPLAHVLEIYRLDGDHWSPAGGFRGDVSARAEPFAAIEIDLARWWIPFAAASDTPGNQSPG